MTCLPGAGGKSLLPCFLSTLLLYSQASSESSNLEHCNNTAVSSYFNNNLSGSSTASIIPESDHQILNNIKPALMLVSLTDFFKAISIKQAVRTPWLHTCFWYVLLCLAYNKSDVQVFQIKTYPLFLIILECLSAQNKKERHHVVIAWSRRNLNAIMNLAKIPGDQIRLFESDSQN